MQRWNLLVFCALTMAACGSTERLDLRRVAAKSPTWEASIQPMLSSQDKTRIYKCTVCHEEYSDREYVADPANIKAMINSMQNGVMPRGGDRVSKKDITLLQTWADRGFP